jgi:hypothetical protein
MRRDSSILHCTPNQSGTDPGESWCEVMQFALADMERVDTFVHEKPRSPSPRREPSRFELDGQPWLLTNRGRFDDITGDIIPQSDLAPVPGASPMGASRACRASCFARVFIRQGNDMKRPMRTAFLAVIAVAVGATAHANVIYVRTDATGANNGANWADAYTSLQAALGAARVGDEIWVCAAVYTPAAPNGLRTASFEMRSRVAIYGGFAGTETQIEQRDFVVNVTTLSGDLNGDDAQPGGLGDNSFHVVRATNVDATGILDGFVVRAGNGSSATGADRNGAGLLIVGGAPVFRNCTIRQNATWTGDAFATGDGGDGGGAHISGNASPLFQNCSFTSNQAGQGAFNFSGQGYRGGDGGAAYGIGGEIRFEGCTFSSNRTGNGGGTDAQTALGGRGGDGGAIVQTGGSIELIDCGFNANLTGIGAGPGSNMGQPTRSGNGGAVAATTAVLAITACDFASNQTGNERGGDGAAVYIANSPTASITGASFSGNVCGNGIYTAGSGGAVFFTGTALAIANTTFRNNRAGNGAGIFGGATGGSGGALFQSGGNLTVDRGEFSDNQAGGSAGGFLPVAGSGGAMVLSSATIRGVKFLRNAAGTAASATNGKGGAVVVNGASTFVNCLFADNSAPGANSSAIGGAVFASQAGLELVNCTLANNLASSGTGGGVWVQAGLGADNCIFWNNADAGGTDESAQIDGFVAVGSIDYSIVQGWTGAFGGTSNTGADPLFVDPAFHLAAGSPGIDSGNAFAVPIGITTDLDGQARFADDPAAPNTGAPFPAYVDRGAYETAGTPYCSGDLDEDHDVNLADLALLLSQFSLAGEGLAGDQNRDGTVGLADLAILLSNFGQMCP